MSRSYLRNKWTRKYMRELYKKSFSTHRNPHHLDEMPKNWPSRLITSHCSADVHWLQESTSFGGHSIPKGGHRRVSGIVRASIKEETRKEIQDQMKEIDEESTQGQTDTMSIEEAKERTIESVRKIYEENGFNEEEFDLSKYLDSIPYEELKNQYEDYSSYEIINGFDTLPEDLSNQINEDDDR